MENLRPINHLDILKRDWRKVLIITLVIVLLALIVSLVQPFLYQASVSVLVVQKSSFSIDAYSASKSEERIANKLAQVVHSSSFQKSVFKSGFDIDETYFPGDELKLRKQWSQTVEPEVVAGLSKLKISVFHPDPNQALQISQAVAYTLTAEKQTYIGIEDVDLKVIDTPLVSKYPVKPNIVINIFLGLVLGLLLGVAYVILFYRPERDRLMQMESMQNVTPHLVENSETADEDVVEEEVAAMPEIGDLDEVEELEAAEEMPEKPVEEEQENLDEELELPSVTDFDEGVVFEQTQNDTEEAVDENDTDESYAKFEEEDEVIGMPGK
jgi:capsular polysaccharide biosynthesis protein